MAFKNCSSVKKSSLKQNFKITNDKEEGNEQTGYPKVVHKVYSHIHSPVYDKRANFSS